MKNAVKILKNKLKKSKGFSLVELLFSIIILMLSTTVIIQCFNLGLGNVIRETRASEAQLLCSALTSSLQNELTYARDITLSDDKKTLVSYFSSSRRMGADMEIAVDNGEIIIRNTENAADIYPLVASSNYTAKDRSGVKGGSTYFLQAHLQDNKIQWDDTEKEFKVTIWVDDPNHAVSLADAKDKALAYAQFSVKPLSGVDE